uniref:NADH-ubiquinone oxidoreductase chain 3 n=1 Tax=Bovicola caprae TaxID=1647116 RepID=A0A3P8MXI5_9NEOP|nr:NADH dehydrogenase subunit 3 [Bovicola caprae]
MFFMAFLMSLAVLSFLLVISSLFFLSEPQSGVSDSFECGLEMINSNRIPFHIHYFLVGVLFLIFDIEFVSSLPLAFFWESSVVWHGVWGSYFFLMFIGLVLEVFLGTIEWKS